MLCLDKVNYALNITLDEIPYGILPVWCLIYQYDNLQMWPKMQHAEHVLDMKPWVLDVTLIAYLVLDRPLLHDASG